MKIIGIPALGVLMMLNGCSVIPGLSDNKPVAREEVGQSPVNNDFLDRVALNFTNLISQIDGLQPPDAIMRFNEATYSAAFSLSLGKAMQAAGYTVEQVSETTIANLVSHNIHQEVWADSTETYTYFITVGDVQLRREYAIADNGNLMPVGKFGVKGVENSSIKQDDSMFLY